MAFTAWWTPAFSTPAGANASGSNSGSAIAMTDSGIGPSEFGIKGTEDLGGGMKANFDLESGISVANGGLGNGTGNFFGRQTGWTKWEFRGCQTGRAVLTILYVPLRLRSTQLFRIR
jgi:hypothetical protein